MQFRKTLKRLANNFYSLSLSDSFDISIHNILDWNVKHEIKII